MNFIRGFLPPKGLGPITRKNYINVQIDAIGVGLANSASPFLPVFLVRLGATALQVSLLTTMPAIAGLLFAIPLGRLLQGQRRIIPWFSGSRLAVLSCYAVTGLLVFFVPQDQLIVAILIIWAIATIPQTLLAITFSVVMNAVAGPSGRFELMTRRWSTMGLTTTITVLLIGQLLGQAGFPMNYQLMFIALSIGGLISFYFSSHIILADAAPPIRTQSSNKNQVKEYLNQIKSQKPFTSFVAKRFVYLTGVSLAAPLFPIYFVREIQVSDKWIASITVIQSAVMILGYYFWTRRSRSRGTRYTLLWTTFGLSFYPILTAFTHQPWIIAIYAGMAGIFQAGLDLVFFDELLKTVPPQYSATFVSFAQSIQYVSAIASPLIGSYLAVHLGISTALVISGGIRLVGFSLFLLGGKSQNEPVPEVLSSG